MIKITTAKLKIRMIEYLYSIFIGFYSVSFYRFAFFYLFTLTLRSGSSFHFDFYLIWVLILSAMIDPIGVITAIYKQIFDIFAGLL